MVKTIASNVTTGITLNSSYNPLYINSGITVSNASYYAIKGTSASAYTITNYGSVLGPGGGGIYLTGGGTLTNKTNAVVSGTNVGALFLAISTISNDGTISSAGDGIILSRGGAITNTGNGLIAGGYRAISAGYAPGAPKTTITNYGSISGKISMGVTGDQVTNQSTGRISGSSYGILLRGTVTNYGVISGPHGGIQEVGGVISNALPTAVISGGTYGVLMGTYGGTLSNAGMITATAAGGIGVEMFGAGQLTNASNATIAASAGFGVYIISASTILNEGLISGSNFALDVKTGRSAEVQLAPTGSFSGKVSGGNTIGSAVESSLVLLSGASTGTISGLGPTVYDFANVTFASSATWLVGGNTVGIAGGETFSGFALGDELDITGVTGESVSGFSNNTLSLSGTANLNIAIPGAFSAGSFTVQDDLSGGTSITLACFAEGTRIRTPDGDIPVETLLPGMLALTHAGEASDIVWLGHRAVDCRGYTDPAKVWPVRVRAGAFGPGLPSRDLRLSPDHAVFVDGVLIPIRHLINGDTIRQEPVESITYYHVELREHDVILAEDLPVESYLDTGDRANFTNGLFPDFSTRASEPHKVWEARGCASLIVTGRILETVRHRIESIAAR